jgi:hypothetical protein
MFNLAYMGREGWTLEREKQDLRIKSRRDG